MSSVETLTKWIYDPSTGTYSLTCSQEYFNSIMSLLQQNNNGIQRLNDLVAELQQDNIYTHTLLNQFSGRTTLSRSPTNIETNTCDVAPPELPITPMSSDKKTTENVKILISNKPTPEKGISKKPTSFPKDPRIKPKNKKEINKTDGFEDGFEDGIKKTELCKWFMTKKYCRYGDKCNFAHGEEELRKKKDYSSRDSKYYKRSRDDYHDRRDRHDHRYSRDRDYSCDRDYSHVRRDKYERHSKKRRHSYHY